MRTRPERQLARGARRQLGRPGTARPHTPVRANATDQPPALEDALQVYRQPDRHQEDLLTDIFQKRQGSKILRDAGVTGVPTDPISTLSEMPLTSYSDYEPTIQAMLAASEGSSAEDLAALERASADFFGPGPTVEFFITTSGTTGAVKAFPWFNGLFQQRLAVNMHVFQFVRHKFPAMMSEDLVPLQLDTVGPPTALGNGLLIGPAGNVFRWLFTKGDSKETLFGRRLFPQSCSDYPDAKTGCYCMWLCALPRYASVGMLGATFGGNLLSALGVLNSSVDRLVADLENGVAGEWVPKELRDDVNEYLGGPQPAAARHLREVADDARRRRTPDDPDAPLNVEKLFPNISIVSSVFTGSQRKYCPSIRAFAPTRPFVTIGYAATEVWLGMTSQLLESGPWRLGTGDGGQQTFVFVPNGDAYFEFLPVESLDDPDAHNQIYQDPQAGVKGDASGDAQLQVQDPSASDPRSQLVRLGHLQVGQHYDIVVTTEAGLVRYRMNEIVQVVNYVEGSPAVRLVGRRAEVLNLAGEKITIDQVISVMEECLPTVSEFTAVESIADALDLHFDVFAELADEPLTEQGLRSLAQDVDEGLQRWNSYYHKLRANGRVQPVQLHALSPDSFEHLRDIRVENSSGSTSQYKHPFVLSEQSPWLQVLKPRVLQSSGARG